ncbi:MAG: HAD-IB family hydrolase [Phycisphaerae bacterium]|nr:HAD-IB family hydrolase [Phycisphaerae bacterium]
MQPKIAFFDMDHTLMDNDCDVSWKDFLVDRGLAHPSEREEMTAFFQQYLEGRLDVDGFLDFQLRQFQGKAHEEIHPLIREHFAERVVARIYPEALAAVASLRSASVPTYLLTATNGIIAGPVAEHFGFDGMLATRLETADGRYTGKIIPPYCFHSHKIMYARQTCDRHGVDLRDAAYYGDSTSDIPLLESVGYPTVVNPGQELESRASRDGWAIARWLLAG